jgi:non-homologous end joining protein Ku
MKFPTAEEAKVRPQERQMAVQLIENLAQEFDPSKYHDEYHDRLKEIIKAKAKGKKIEIPETVEREHTKVVDLVSRLQESLAAATGAKKGAKKTARKTTRKRKTA